MEQPATAPATSNAIRWAEKSGNIAKQRFARKGEKVRGYHGNLGGLRNKWYVVRHSDSIETTSIAKIVVRSKVSVILPGIPLERRPNPRSRRTNVVARILTIPT